MPDDHWIDGAIQDGQTDFLKYSMDFQRDGMTQSQAAEAADKRVQAEARVRQTLLDTVTALAHTPEYMSAELHVRLDMIRAHVDNVKEQVFEKLVAPVRLAVDTAAVAVTTEIERRANASRRSDELGDIDIDSDIGGGAEDTGGGTGSD
jgi:hypothetical protein